MKKRLVSANRFGFFPLLLLTLVALIGCAPPSVEKKRFFFPPPPSEPKIEYLGFIQSDHDVARDNINWFADAVFGRERPYPLFKDPYDVSADDKGRAYVSDLGLQEVVVLDTVTGKVRFLGQSGPQRVAFGLPMGVSVGNDGTIGVSDISKKRVYLFDRQEILFVTIDLEKTEHPVGLVVHSEKREVAIVDSKQHQILIYSFDGELIHTLGRRGVGPAEFNFPVDAAYGPDGNLYVLDALNFRIQVFDPEYHVLRVFGEQGTALGSFKMPKGIAVSPSGQVYVTDALANRVVIFDLAGNHLLTLGGKKRFGNDHVVPGGFYLPRGIGTGRDDSIWVVDALNRTLHKFQYLNQTFLEMYPIVPKQIYYPEVK